VKQAEMTARPLTKGNSILKMSGISKAFPGVKALDNVQLELYKGEVHALMGENGAGKSTLLKIVAGENKSTRGGISAPSDAVIAYLPQHLLTSDDCTVIEEASKAFADVLNMKKEIDEINEQLTIRTDYESDAYMKLIERVSELSEKYYSIEEVNYEAEVEKVLKGLGFEREDFTRSTSEFSGGWRMRIELAKILLKKPDLILLDEPTNHLDMKTKDIIKDALKDFDGTLILVSHDRDFLDGLAEKVFEFGHKRVKEHFEDIKGFLAHKKMENLKEIEK